MNPLVNNPMSKGNNLNTVLEMIKGKDPQKVFMDECKKRGVDPNPIIELAKHMN